MVSIPVKFKRIAATFHDVTRVRSCDRSGSEHSMDLFDLVNSFIEREIIEQRKIEEADQDIDVNEFTSVDELERNTQDLEIENSLKKCFDIGNDNVKRSIHAEFENTLVELGSNDAISASDFKRRLMARLRDRGLDASLCKSKWEKNGSCTAGMYEYVDINRNETRYIIKVFLDEEFTIARPTDQSSSLLESFPAIFVGEANELKQAMKLMSKAIRKSMKSRNIHISPWRRPAYLQAKWFSSYKRTTNEISSRRVSEMDEEKGWKRSIGFVPLRGVLCNCREEFVVKGFVKVGNLALALKQ